MIALAELLIDPEPPLEIATEQNRAAEPEQANAEKAPPKTIMHDPLELLEPFAVDRDDQSHVRATGRPSSRARRRPLRSGRWNWITCKPERGRAVRNEP